MISEMLADRRSSNEILEEIKRKVEFFLPMGFENEKQSQKYLSIFAFSAARAFQRCIIY